MDRHRLKELRTSRRLTQAELGRRARIHPAVISQLEHDRVRVWPKLARRLAKALQVPVKELLDERETVQAEADLVKA